MTSMRRACAKYRGKQTRHPTDKEAGYIHNARDC